jgi:uncharacterized protein YabN with tetrapyrrole methylase and pyrophosphatase domain
VGFDWNDTDGPASKVEEELHEVREHLAPSDGRPAITSPIPVDDPRHAALESELGDLLFAVVNLCRRSGVHPALALDRANEKFVRRFEAVERLARERGIDVGTAGLEVLDGLWDEVKRGE